MSYDQFQFIKPPRPTSGVNTPPDTLARFESKGWWGQAKKNGTSNLVFVRPDRGLICMNRHGEEHSQWQGFTEESGQFYATLPGDKWCVFNEELLHAKSQAGYRDTHYVHDVLVWQGVHLTDWSYARRYKLLLKIFQPQNFGGGELTHWVLNPKFWVAKTFTKGLANIHAGLGEFDEGLMLKRPDATLAEASKGGFIRCLKAAQTRRAS